MLATHNGDPSPKSLSTLIHLTEISDHAHLGVQWRRSDLVFDHGCRDGHYDVRHVYTRRLRMRRDCGAYIVHGAVGGCGIRHGGKVLNKISGRSETILVVTLLK